MTEGTFRNVSVPLSIATESSFYRSSYEYTDSIDSRFVF